MNRFQKYTGHAPLVLALLALGSAGCVFPGQPNPAARPVPPDRIVAFDALYRQNCAGCHGADGKLGPAPPLNDPLFRAIVPAETVQDVVAGGRHGTLMPAWAQEQGGPLTPAQVAVLVYEIKGIPYRVEETQEGDKTRIDVVRDPTGTAPTWGPPGLSPPDAPPYAMPEDGTGGAKVGEKVFADACAACHGDNGHGFKKDDLLALPINDPAFRTFAAAQAAVLTDGRVALKINDPAFLAVISDQALRRIVITGRADLGMPDYAHHGKDALTPEDVTNVVAFLRAQRSATSERRPGPDVTREAHHE